MMQISLKGLALAHDVRGGKTAEEICAAIGGGRLGSRVLTTFASGWCGGEPTAEDIRAAVRFAFRVQDAWWWHSKERFNLVWLCETLGDTFTAHEWADLSDAGRLARIGTAASAKELAEQTDWDVYGKEELAEILEEAFLWAKNWTEL